MLGCQNYLKKRLLMIDTRLLDGIMDEYLMLLEKYVPRIDSLSINDCRKIVGDVKLFWYRKRKSVDYTLTHIQEKDSASFLAGAIKLDIKNNGHYEFVLAGQTRFINDPILKMQIFYKNNEEDVSFEYINKYLKDCLVDIVYILKNYKTDYYILPINVVEQSEYSKYMDSTEEIAENMVLSLFSVDYCDKEEFFKDNKTYEEIESKLISHITNSIIFSDYNDCKLTLRERCDNYICNHERVLKSIETLDEPRLFFLLVLQFMMQTVDIITIMNIYRITPFIRQDVPFEYFRMLYNSSIRDTISKKQFLNVYLAYTINKLYNFSDRDYEDIKKDLGDGKLIGSIISKCDNDDMPSVIDIKNNVEMYLKTV